MKKIVITGLMLAMMAGESFGAAAADQLGKKRTRDQEPSLDLLLEEEQLPAEAKRLKPDTKLSEAELWTIINELKGPAAKDLQGKIMQGASADEVAQHLKSRIPPHILNLLPNSIRFFFGIAKVDDKDTQGRAALHEAARLGMLSVVTKLMELDASINLPDAQGNTALHLAAIGGHLSVVQFLVEKKANRYCNNQHGDTPLDVAIKKNRLEIVQFLVEKSLSSENNPIYSLRKLLVKAARNDKPVAEEISNYFFELSLNSICEILKTVCDAPAGLEEACNVLRFTLKKLGPKNAATIIRQARLCDQTLGTGNIELLELLVDTLITEISIESTDACKVASSQEFSIKDSHFFKLIEELLSEAIRNNNDAMAILLRNRLEKICEIPVIGKLD